MLTAKNDMEHVDINPPDYKSEYVKYLNLCFTGWGDENKFDWVFSRKVGEKSADLIIIKNEAKEVIAGSGVTYRKLITPSGDIIDISIMTGSWTLPAARGKGCFSKLIILSQELAKEKKVDFLTAFVTESNASYRRLKDAGSILVPTFHLFSPVDIFNDPASFTEVEPTQINIAKIYDRFKSCQENFVKFSYTEEEFALQYIYRTGKPVLLNTGNEYAIIEETHNVVMVLLLTYDAISEFEIMIKSLSNWAWKNKSKKILLFSTRNEISGVCSNLNFEMIPGYFTVRSSATSIDIQSSLRMLNINGGDKI